MGKTNVGVDPDYNSRFEKEIEHYKSVANVHDLPGICYYYVERWVRPKMREVLGVSTVEDFYA